MKFIPVILLFALATNLASAQKVQKLKTPEEIIETILDKGLFEEHDERAIGGLGDQAAVVLTKVIGERKLASKQVDRGLLILNWAFTELQDARQDQPRTAFFVLRYLDSQTPDPKLKAEIAKTRKFILERYAKPMKP